MIHKHWNKSTMLVSTIVPILIGLFLVFALPDSSYCDEAKNKEKCLSEHLSRALIIILIICIGLWVVGIICLPMLENEPVKTISRDALGVTNGSET